MKTSSHRDRALKLALIAIMAATLEGGKLALSFIPNVEIVTLLCAIYGYVFGFYGIIATYIFVGIETLIWGANTWVVTYLIHWGCVSFVFMLLGKFKIRSRLIATATAVILTVAFGVLSSLVDTGLLTGFFDNFWKRFAIIYTRGVAFYVAQIVCNLLLFLIVFKPLVNRIEMLLPERFKSVSIRK
ncbi:MAG: hypothetical protein K2O31_06440 [Clostridia bacterium]|nr:hypothetical protein [Clostridia bacterium]MDE6869394.1 hypothetical protein [Clostridia bacterium]MDE7209506.1 hypothetical protein [Clostridia bacterium]